jgi:hypothetical protein
MSSSQQFSRKDRALFLVQKGLWIFPVCWPSEKGCCACGRRQPHVGHDIAKAPLAKRGVNDSSNAIRQVWEWWDQNPHANIGIDLDRSGLVDIAPDSEEWLEIFQERGLPPTASFASGGGAGHEHFLYRRPADTPLININRTTEYDLQPRGYCVAPGSLHQSGRTYEWTSDFPWKDAEDLPFAPEWALAEIRVKWASHWEVPEIDIDFQAPLQLKPELMEGTLGEWWNGDRFATLADGQVDRSLTLFNIGRLLEKVGATEGEIAATLRDRDEALGYFKYCRRRDGGVKQYTTIAQAVTSGRAALPGGALAWGQIVDAVGKHHDPQSYLGLKVNVPNTVSGNLSTYRKEDIPFKSRKKGNLRPSSTWDFCCETFPYPTGVRPKVKSAVMLNPVEGQAIIGDLYSNTWLNRANECFKRRSLLFNLIRTFAKQDTFTRCVAADDWGEAKHESITKAVERAGGKYYSVDNLVSRGCWVYLSGVAAPGFEPVAPEGLVPFLVDAVKGIRVPVRLEPGKRFRPTRASRALTKVIDEASVDEDRDKFQLLAMKEEETDYPLVEATLREAGLRYEYIAPVYRAMPWQCLRVHVGTAFPFEQLLDLLVGLGYSPRRKRKGVAA